jgi:hypothetical protein
VDLFHRHFYYRSALRRHRELGGREGTGLTVFILNFATGHAGGVVGGHWRAVGLGYTVKPVKHIRV